MKMTRNKIKNLIESNKNKIKKLEDENVLLEIQSYQISDKEQWYTEEDVEFIKRVARRKVTEKARVGCIHWVDKFKDESTGSVVEVERRRMVMKNGEWFLK